MNQPIILASTSPRRKDLLQMIGLNFKTIPSNYEEDMTMDMDHKKLVKTLAYGKAKDVVDRLKSGIVIGADTFVVIKNKRIGKPKSKKEAKETLQLLSNKSADIYSGIAIIDVKNNKKIIDAEISKVLFKKLSNKEITEYIKTEEPMDKAGAFAIQGKSYIYKKN